MTTATDPVHRQLGMTDDEYESVVDILGRPPRAGRACHVLRHVV